MNVRDAFYEILRTHGITTIFGNPGSNELPLLSDFDGGQLRLGLKGEDAPVVVSGDGNVAREAPPLPRG